jgi:hypothetical protein
MLGRQTKYKIWWFVVDLYHRQRYFFICDLNQIVKKPDVKSRRRAVERREFLAVPSFRIAFFVKGSICSCPGRITPVRAGYSHTFLSIERII